MSQKVACISQGSVATHLRCGRCVVKHLTTNLNYRFAAKSHGGRHLKTSQHLQKLWPRVQWHLCTMTVSKEASK